MGVALYLRLSKENGDEVSESILNQKSFLTDYARKNGFLITDIFSDDGYSGTNFDRPDFLRMKHKIEKGEIKTVITKDLSRLGRDYIETGYYLEKYFPSHNVRYIAVNDNIDTQNQLDDFSPFKAVLNDMYAKDISKKVKTALDTKKKMGKFIGSSAPFGYKKSNDKNILIPDENAYIIKKIYKLYQKYKSFSRVAEILSSQKIITPSEAKKSASEPKKWNDVMVKHILTNPTYAGNLTQNRSRKLSYKLKKRIYLPKSCWITVYNTHTAIISQSEFDRINKIIQKKLT